MAERDIVETETNNCDIQRRFYIDKGILVLVVIFIIIGVLMIRDSGFQLKSDGPNYFVYLRSMVFDHNIDFRNEYFNFDKAFWDTYRPKLTSTGYYTNVFSVGPAVLWAPFYVAAHLFVLTANYFGTKYVPDGFGPPYIAAINLASLVYSFLGTVLVYKTCCRYFSALVSLLASAGAFLSTFILYYVVFEPYMSHPVSYFCVSLFIWYWNKTRRERTPYQWIILGLTAGLMNLVRWQNGLFMILPAFESIAAYQTYISGRKRDCFCRLLKNNVIFLVFTVIGFFPQMLAWKTIYGGYLTIPQGSAFLRWAKPFISEVLFSSRHGLFSWSPIVYLSTVGWFLFSKKDKLLFWGGTTAFLSMLYINSIVSDWWAGWGFGMRRFDGFILFFAIGLAALFSGKLKTWPRTGTIFVAGVLILFTGFNVHLMNQLNSVKISPGGTVSFDKVFGLNEKNYNENGVNGNSLYASIGNPFSFPANALFSLEYREPPSKYDTLVGGYVDDPLCYGNTITMGEPSPLLAKGWSAPEKYTWHSWRTMEKFASIYVPVLNTTDFSMTFYAKAITSINNRLFVYVNGTKAASVNFKPDWSWYTVRISKEYLKPGLNIVAFVDNPEDTVSFESISFYSLETIQNWK